MASASATFSYTQLRESALALTTKERLDLADALYISLDQSGEQALSPVWLEEIERRSEELRSGKVQTIPHEEVMQELNALVDSL